MESSGAREETRHPWVNPPTVVRPSSPLKTVR
jgi:hypothetical protein